MGRLERWREDTLRSIEELRQRSGCDSVCPVGLRLGGTLGVMAAQGGASFERMILWDGVFSGHSYLAELRALHEEMLRVAHVISRDPAEGDSSTELLGFRFPDAIVRELEKLDLLSGAELPAKRILVIESNAQSEQTTFSEHLEGIGAAVDFERQPTPDFWIWEEDFGNVHVPGSVIRSIVSWLSRDAE